MKLLEALKDILFFCPKWPGKKPVLSVDDIPNLFSLDELILHVNAFITIFAV